MTLIAAVGVVLLGWAWAVASYPGSSPDDNFHLASIWCAWGRDASGCSVGDVRGGYNSVSVPGLEEHLSSCVTRQPSESAACVYSPGNPDLIASANRDSYPGGYYAAARSLVGSDVLLSVVAIRVGSYFAALALLIAGGLVLGVRERWRAWWNAAVLAVPLGLFMFASTNPSGVAIAGAFAASASGYAVGRAQSRTRLLLGALVGALATLVAATARPDGWLFASLAVGVGALAAWRSWRDWVRPARIAAWAVALAPPLIAKVSAGTGVTGGSGLGDAGAGWSLAWANLKQVWRLYVGSFATNLGWFDTPMPTIVSGYVAAGVITVLLVGMRDMNAPRGLALAVGGAAGVLLPLYMLQSLGFPVGIWVQPRYLLPIVFALGVLLAVRPGRDTGVPLFALWAACAPVAVANSIALHQTLRRSITGTDVSGWNLNEGIEWWWPSSVSPMLVWTVGSLAYAVVLTAIGARIWRHGGDPDHRHARDAAALPSRQVR